MKKEEQARLAATSAASYLRTKLADMRISYVLAEQDEEDGKHWRRAVLTTVSADPDTGKPAYQAVTEAAGTDALELNTARLYPPPAAGTDTTGTSNTRAALEKLLRAVADSGAGKRSGTGPGALRDDYMIELRAEAVCAVTESRIITGWSEIWDGGSPDRVRVGWEAKDPEDYTTIKTVSVEWPADRMSVEKVGAP